MTECIKFARFEIKFATFEIKFAIFEIKFAIFEINLALIFWFNWLKVDMKLIKFLWIVKFCSKE